MRTDDEEFLANALSRESQGRGLKNSELSAIRAMDKIHVAPLVRAPAPRREGPADPAGNMLSGRDTLGREVPAVDLTARVAALEALLDGFARRSISVCDAGTEKTMTIASTAPA